ncbi:c-type cytochrome [Aquabacterium humicola]|uniref:c-type cytochrome n=1 Tax=Aquabacterium humicola TaxID=3237377 RepID=UPI002542C2FE|nr:cytochrome c [Rubrivivax pictus]
MSRALRALLAALLASLLAACGGGRSADDPTQATPPAATPQQIAHGAYLATLGNCAGCHTMPGGAAYAGGRGLATPFGMVYAGNLTPDAATGLGRWSAEDFWRALHHGRSRDGRRLLPAFPYTAFTQVRREDSDALFAYLRSLPPVNRTNTAHALRFPYDTPAAIAVWQWLFFTPGTPPPAAADADPVARGAYLVNGLGHCAACHAPRNVLGASSAAPAGGDILGQPWYAPSLHPSAGRRASADELVQLLRSGRNALDSATGPMAAVIFRSTQHWKDADLQAVAAYLTRLQPQPADDPPEPASPAQLLRGGELYGRHCADCHGQRGEGRAGAYPPLAGNATVQQPGARNLVQLMRHGSFAPATAANPQPYSMPHAGLDTRDMAAVASYVRQSWGNRASAVDEIDVLKLQ